MAKEAIIRLLVSATAISAIFAVTSANAAPSLETLKQLSAKCFDDGSWWSGSGNTFKSGSGKIWFLYQSHDQNDADAANGIVKRLHYGGSILAKIGGSGDWRRIEDSYVVVIRRSSWEFAIDGDDGYPKTSCHQTFNGSGS